MGHDFESQPELAMLLTRLDEMKMVLGPESVGRLDLVRIELERALALRADGDAPGAAAAIGRAMRELAAVADGLDPAEGALMRAAVDVFGRALVRGETGEIERTADVMRERSGARRVEKKS